MTHSLARRTGTVSAFVAAAGVTMVAGCWPIVGAASASELPAAGQAPLVQAKKRTFGPPVAAQPVPSAPVATVPVASEPVATEPVATGPVATEPVASEPVAKAPEAEPAGRGRSGEAPGQSAPVDSGTSAPTTETTTPTAPEQGKPAPGTAVDKGQGGAADAATPVPAADEPVAGPPPAGAAAPDRAAERAAAERAAAERAAAERAAAERAAAERAAAERAAAEQAAPAPVAAPGRRPSRPARRTGAVVGPTVPRTSVPASGDSTAVQRPRTPARPVFGPPSAPDSAVLGDSLSSAASAGGGAAVPLGGLGGVSKGRRAGILTATDPLPLRPLGAAGGTPAGQRPAPPLRPQPAVLPGDLSTALPRLAGDTAAAVADKPELPLGIGVVVVLFLVLQSRIDRRDPKLALARVRDDEPLVFVPAGDARGAGVAAPQDPGSATTGARVRLRLVSAA